MYKDSKLHEKLIENARSQVGQLSRKNTDPYRSPDEKMKEIRENAKNLRGKHAKLLGK